ncbi:MAG: TrkA family potassium uptake protein [Synergistaceae bacterium]|nr:TrkA family potassium uptake protein [Synergistaceae bacterium]
MKNVLLIGLGRFGRHVARQLVELGHEVLAVDTDEERVNNVLSVVNDAQIGDATNMAFLRSIGVANFDVCFVTISANFQNSLEVTSLLKDLGAKMVVSRAERDVQEKFLLKNGADYVVYPEKQLALWAAYRYSADNLLDYTKLDDSHSIVDVRIPKAWIGKTVSEVNVRKRYSLNILAIKKNGTVTTNITPETIFEENSNILILGGDRALKDCLDI